MEAIKRLTEQRMVLPAIGLVLGLGLGLLVGWVILPVQWTDAEPALLREDLRQDYLSMAVESYSVNRDAEAAVQRYLSLGEAGPQTLSALAAEPGGLDPTAIQRFRAVIEIMGEATPLPVSPEEPVGETPPDRAPLGVARYILPVCGVTVVLGVLLVVALYLRNRMSSAGALSGDDLGEVVRGFDSGTGYAAPAESGGREPLATFRTTYTIGDDLYDDSFSIETSAGDFVGECGVGIADLIGVGEPKKVSAFEVWLFDKNDIQTVTKVFMSRYAFADEKIRSRLAAKGDPVQAEGGAAAYLETASLEVEARIVDMTYGEGPLPQGSFFERLTIELRAWPRVEGLS